MTCNWLQTTENVALYNLIRYQLFVKFIFLSTIQNIIFTIKNQSSIFREWIEHDLDPYDPQNGLKTASKRFRKSHEILISDLS